MTAQTRLTVRIALIVSLGGFLMGFDASVISGVVGFIEVEFDLGDIELGWAVASLTLTSTLAMLVAGPLSDRYGRRPVLKLAALLFAVSAVASALAPDYLTLVIARMIGGLGVGAALIIAPMYIAEIAPADLRGRLVSLNQLNIVLGISAAFFSNYLILKLGQLNAEWVGTLGIDAWSWRWMLGVETLPALIYLSCLYAVPESPRWLVMHGREEAALGIMARLSSAREAAVELRAVLDSLAASAAEAATPLRALFAPALRLVLAIALTVAVLQQITGINAVFFYAPMIFEQSGIGTDASFLQAVLVGLTNLVFTVLAILFVDRLGRRPLLGFGVAGVAVCMALLAYGFHAATYAFTPETIAALPEGIDRDALSALAGVTFETDVEFKTAVAGALGTEALRDFESALVAAAISIDPRLILAGILGFVASFAISLGPIMWVLFSELFPNRVRGLAVSFAGFVNSSVSFLVQLAFPWELSVLGSATTFLIYGAFAVIGLALVMRLLPETKGKSLEELEALHAR